MESSKTQLWKTLLIATTTFLLGILVGLAMAQPGAYALNEFTFDAVLSSNTILILFVLGALFCVAVWHNHLSTKKED